MGLLQTLSFIVNHPMNRGRQAAALARFAAWQIECRLNEEVVFDWVHGAKLAVRRGMTGATGNVYCGLHEYVDMRFVLDTLRDGDIFADIGANVGSYTVLAAKVCGAHTISFEPDPETVRHLRRNVELNKINSHVEIIEAALGAEPGHLQFTIGRDTVNRVAQPGDLFTREVEVRRLDDVLAGRVPRIIKIDVEGFEGEVLKGASRTLASRSLEAIISEASDNEVVNVLLRHGFHMSHYDPNARVFSSTSRFHSNNCIFIRPEKFDMK